MTKTIKPTTKVIVTVVAAVLAAVLIAGIVVGILYYFNSNYYRYRMSAFEGEYFNAGLTSDSHCVLSVEFTRREVGNEWLYVYVFENDGTRELKAYLSKEKQRTEISMEDMDLNLTQFVTNCSNALGSKCTLYNDKLVFNDGESELKIQKNEYLPDGTLFKRYPIRMMDVYNSDYNLCFTLDFITYHTKAGDMASLYGDFIEFVIDNRLEIKGTNDVTYFADIKAGYYYTDDYQKKLEAGFIK